MINAHNCWYVPLRVMQEEAYKGLSNLHPADAEFLEQDTFVETGNAFTILLKGFYVYENYEGDQTGNDLLMQSRIRYASEPELEVINFFDTDIPDKTFQGDLEYQHIFARQDVAPGDVFSINLELTEIDKGLGRDGQLPASYRAMHQQFGAVFSKLVPFAGKALMVVRVLLKLKEMATRNTQILNCNLHLHTQIPGPDEVPLRYGAYVFFKEPVEGIQYKLDDNYQLQRTSRQQSEVPIQDDYIAIASLPGLVETQKSAESLLQNQQLATVLSYLNREEEEQTEKEAYINYTEKLIKDTATLKAMEAYQKLKQDRLAGLELSSVQQQRLATLKGQLAKYLKVLSDSESDRLI